MFVAIMGYGTVGTGVADLLKLNESTIAKRNSGEEIKVKRILDIRKFPGDRFEHLITDRFEDIENDGEISLVVETMGGLNPAYDFVSRCLKAGKSVVTSNKELVAQKGYELLCLARENGVNFLFEASTGGGIPALRPIYRCLADNEIVKVAGILNGTTNFILTKMIDEGSSFEDALAIAQKLGYAEANPSADVDGLDALRKICILCALCFGSHVYPASVKAQGIRDITPADVEYAGKLGCVIKLIASAEKTAGGKIAVTVSPAFVKCGTQISVCSDVFNIITVTGNAVGEVAFYGPGAGKMPTASAVVADVMDIAKSGGRDISPVWTDEIPGNIITGDDFVCRRIVRVKAGGDVISLFEGAQPVEPAAGETAFVTAPMSFTELSAKLSAAGSELISAIRIFE